MSRHKISEIDYIQWGCLSPEQWRAISVVNVTKPSSKDGGGTEDRNGTPYDPRLGEQRNYTPCGTCNKPNTECPGHFGTIELPFPVYNRMFAPVILKILQATCMHCSRPRMLPEYIDMQGLSNYRGFGRLKAIVEKCKNVKKCPWEDCGEVMVEFGTPDQKKSESGVIYYSVTHECSKDCSCTTDSGITTKREEFSAGSALGVLSRISDEHLEVIGFNGHLLPNEKYQDPKYFPNEHYKHVHQFRPEAMIFTVLPVLPPLARPWVVSEGEDDEKKDDDLTDKYNSILKSINLWHTFGVDGSLQAAGEKRTVTRRGNMKTKADVERDIMFHIWTLIDNKGGTSKLSSGGREHRSLVDRLKGKGGRVQNNVGGKRCNFSARTVIIPGGIRLRDDELGIPEEIARTLTKPEFVGPWNIEEIQKLVSLGRVNCVLRAGRNTKLSEFPDHGSHFQLRNGDIAERQLQDGDSVLFNRQPTLRMESMMKFSAKIVDTLAFQLGLCWTKSFNADFDGVVKRCCQQGA